MSTAKKHRYKHVDGKRLIEIRVKTANQLFDIRDPAPFRERDLDDDFVDYISSSSKEFSLSTPLKILIHIESSELADLNKAAIKEAIHSHTAYQIELQEQNLKDFVRRGQLVLVLGVTVLSICLGISTSIPDDPAPSRFLEMLKEGLVIIGWVSMWRPMELLLFDWLPLYDKLRLLRKLLATEIDIQFGTK